MNITSISNLISHIPSNLGAARGKIQALWAQVAVGSSAVTAVNPGRLKGTLGLGALQEKLEALWAAGASSAAELEALGKNCLDRPFKIDDISFLRHEGGAGYAATVWIDGEALNVTGNQVLLTWKPGDTVVARGPEWILSDEPWASVSIHEFYNLEAGNGAIPSDYSTEVLQQCGYTPMKASEVWEQALHHATLPGAEWVKGEVRAPGAFAQQRMLGKELKITRTHYLGHENNTLHGGTIVELEDGSLWPLTDCPRDWKVGDRVVLKSVAGEPDYFTNNSAIDLHNVTRRNHSNELWRGEAGMESLTDSLNFSDLTRLPDLKDQVDWLGQVVEIGSVQRITLEEVGSVTIVHCIYPDHPFNIAYDNTFAIKGDYPDWRIGDKMTLHSVANPPRPVVVNPAKPFDGYQPALNEVVSLEMENLTTGTKTQQAVAELKIQDSLEAKRWRELNPHKTVGDRLQEYLAEQDPTPDFSAYSHGRGVGKFDWASIPVPPGLLELELEQAAEMASEMAIDLGESALVNNSWLG